MRQNHRIISFAVLITYILFLGLVLLLPSQTVSSFNAINDKVAHFCLFVILSFLFSYALRSYGYSPYFLAFIGSVGIAFITESLQMLTKTRTFTSGDLFSDMGGAAVGIGCFFLLSLDKKIRQ